MLSTRSRVRRSWGPSSMPSVRALAAGIALGVVSLSASGSGAQPTPVFEASGYAVVRPYHLSGIPLWGYNPLELALRPADAIAPAEIVTFPGYSSLLRAERWRISADGVPWFAGYVALSSHATCTAWVDMNGDGYSDLVVGETSQTGRGVEVFIMTPAGLQTPGRYFGLAQNGSGDIQSILGGDWNADGRMDLCLGRSDDRGEGGSIFVSTEADSLAQVPGSVFGSQQVSLDVDGDPHADLIGFNRRDMMLCVNHGLGDGKFGDANWIPFATDQAPILGHFDGDGIVDLVTGRYLFRGVDSAMPVIVDTLDHAVRAVADFDHDGLDDLLAVDVGGFLLARCLGGGRFGAFEAFDLGGLMFSGYYGSGLIAAGDVNGDGWIDVVGTDLNAHTLQVVEGKPPGAFYRPLEFSTGASPAQVELADIVADDQVLDAIVLARGARRLEVRRGNGDGSFDAMASFETPAGARRFALTDFDEDGRLDAVVACDSARALAILWGDAGGFGERTDFPVADSLREISIADIDEDGHLDIIVSTSRERAMGWSGNETRNPQALAISNRAPLAGQFLLHHVDDDAHLDLVCQTPYSSFQDYEVDFGDGHGNFGNRWPWPGFYLPGGANPNSLRSPFTFAAFPGFERELLFHLSRQDWPEPRYSWLSGGDFTVSIDGVIWAHHLGTWHYPSNYPGESPTYELPRGAVQLAVADVTIDGIPDIVSLSREEGLLTVLPGQPGAFFGEPISHTVGCLPSSFALGDVDGNGTPDVLVANEGANSVTVLRHRSLSVSGVPVASANRGLELRALGAIGAARPRLQLTLASTEPAVLELFDTQGRRLANHRVDSPAPGARVVELGEERLPRAGLVFARLRQGLASATTRLVRLP